LEGKITPLKSLLLLFLGVGVSIVLVKQFPFLGSVVLGSGEGEMVGYYGGDASYRRDCFSSLYVHVSPSVDIYDLTLLANTSGYETGLVTQPLEHDPYPPRVAISRNLTVCPGKIEIRFTIIVLEDGCLTVKVASNYYLSETWMRTVFRKMFQDIHLPPETISRFKLAINYLVRAY
jgi:hypothetical protein